MMTSWRTRRFLHGQFLFSAGVTSILFALEQKVCLDHNHSCPAVVHANVLSDEEIEASEEIVRAFIKAASDTKSIIRFFKKDGKTLDLHGKQKVRPVVVVPQC